MNSLKADGLKVGDRLALVMSPKWGGMGSGYVKVHVVERITKTTVSIRGINAQEPKTYSILSDGTLSDRARGAGRGDRWSASPSWYREDDAFVEETREEIRRRNDFSAARHTVETWMKDASLENTREAMKALAEWSARLSTEADQ